MNEVEELLKKINSDINLKLKLSVLTMSIILVLFIIGCFIF